MHMHLKMPEGILTWISISGCLPGIPTCRSFLPCQEASQHAYASQDARGHLDIDIHLRMPPGHPNMHMHVKMPGDIPTCICISRCLLAWQDGHASQDVPGGMQTCKCIPRCSGVHLDMHMHVRMPPRHADMHKHVKMPRDAYQHA